MCIRQHDSSSIGQQIEGWPFAQFQQSALQSQLRSALRGNSMLRLIFFTLLLYAAGMAAAQDTAPEAITDFTDHPPASVRNINGLNVRRTPAMETDNIVGRLQPGQQVHVLAREGDWQQVRSEEGLFGWSHSDYLIDLPPREVGETRLFQIWDGPGKKWVLVNAELRHIGEHSYIYFASRAQNKQLNLQSVGDVFNNEIYSPLLALWDLDRVPSYEGDERVVILMLQGYDRAGPNGAITVVARECPAKYVPMPTALAIWNHHRGRV